MEILEELDNHPINTNTDSQILQEFQNSYELTKVIHCFRITGKETTLEEVPLVRGTNGPVRGKWYMCYDCAKFILESPMRHNVHFKPVLYIDSPAIPVPNIIRRKNKWKMVPICEKCYTLKKNDNNPQVPIR